jgi:hypothetical protein
MPAVNRCWLVAAALLCVPAPVVQAQAQGQTQAQGDVTERQVKVATGHDERVGVYTNIKPDCTGGPLPAIRLLAAPAHGSVTVRRGTLKATNFKQCLAAEVPALLAFYRSAANFKRRVRTGNHPAGRTQAGPALPRRCLRQPCGWRREGDLGRGAAMKKYGSAPPPGLRHHRARPRGPC